MENKRKFENAERFAKSLLEKTEPYIDEVISNVNDEEEWLKSERGRKFQQHAIVTMMLFCNAIVKEKDNLYTLHDLFSFSEIYIYEDSLLDKMFEVCGCWLQNIKPPDPIPDYEVDSDEWNQIMEEELFIIYNSRPTKEQIEILNYAVGQYVFMQAALNKNEFNMLMDACAHRITIYALMNTSFTL